ncbi:MAG: anthranilate phosphoribosyltransferase family protein [Synechococcales cyanobacterium CRU_2_2]|nr:anthranilate phosphoribosyltransferase family protein [Synechococcales cyanobacterium CRU_2_2]
MSDAFRRLLKQVGSGTHTSKSLSREAAEEAMTLMLRQEATPAQIGGFMIAHRIRRPTPEELAGMLDAYDVLGPHVEAIAHSKVYVFCYPYDGRSRTAPVAPLVSLILAAAGVASLCHGGRRMPTKFGVPLVELWQQLGVDWTALSLTQLQRVFEQTLLGLVYLPHHFPLAEGLTVYREELGKRPPMASMELIWNPYRGAATLVSGFVHPPTEERLLETLQWRRREGQGATRVLFVKGLEGSCDLPRDRTCILSRHHFEAGSEGEQTHSERLLLHPAEFGQGGPEIAYTTQTDWQNWAEQTLAGELNPLWSAVVWNAGFYLWQANVADDLAMGIAQAQDLLVSGAARKALQILRQTLTPVGTA